MSMAEEQLNRKVRRFLDANPNMAFEEVAKRLGCSTDEVKQVSNAKDAETRLNRLFPDVDVVGCLGLSYSLLRTLGYPGRFPDDLLQLVIGTALGDPEHGIPSQKVPGQYDLRRGARAIRDQPENYATDVRKLDAFGLAKDGHPDATHTPESVPTPAEPAWQTDDYEWVIPRRHKSQELLLAVYKYLQDNPGLKDQPWRRDIFGLIVGASFSLWRAVFLAMPRRAWEGPKGILAGAKELLDKLLDNNALLYSDEKRIEGWSVGYYLNNAYYRIESARQRLSPYKETEALTTFAEQKKRGITNDSPWDAWDIGCDAAFEVLDLLRQRVEPR